MEFRIKTIFLLPVNGKNNLRYIDFHLNKVNVITGSSGKGKSALISIVDYCLGSSRSRIPTGKIRDFTDWYGLHIVLENETEMILARRESRTVSVSGDMYLKEGKSLIVPTEIQGNVNIEQVRKRLNSIARLPEYGIEDSWINQSIDSRPSFRDFVSFNFQPQYIIANQNIMLYRSDLMAQRQKLINIFSYILQAVDNEYIEQRIRLKDIERRMLALNREIDQAEKYISNFLGKLRGYFILAKEFGLTLADVRENWSAFDYVNELEKILSNVNQDHVSIISAKAISETSSRISNLTSQEVNLAHDIHVLRLRQQAIANLFESNRKYSDELIKQNSRLKTSNWFERVLRKGEERCPMCNSESNVGRDYIIELKKVNSDVIKKISKVNDNLTVFSSERKKIDEEIQKRVSEINQVRQELEILINTSKESENTISTIGSIFRFMGNIESEIATYRSLSDSVHLKMKLEGLDIERTSLLREVNRVVVERKIETAKRIILNSISFYSNVFGAENRDELFEFTEKELTLSFRSSTGRDYLLNEIGSGSNYMAYHLSAILGFHEFFLKRNWHPVPNFIFLDQPTQVYFPENDSENFSGDDDVRRVRKIFEVLDLAITRTKGKLQIIVLEHVGEYAWEGFENVVKIKRWRSDESNSDDRALIPDSWLI